MFRISTQVNGVLRGLDLFAEELSDLDGLLRDFSKLKRVEVNQRFQQGGPGWAPLAHSTRAKQEKRQAASSAGQYDRATERMRSKLEREYRRAVKRGDQSAAERRYVVLREFNRIVNGGSEGATLFAPVTDKERGVMKQRRKLTRELRAARKAGNTDRAAKLTEQLDDFDKKNADAINVFADLRLAKSLQKLPERMKRAADKYGGQVLGRVAASIYVKISKGVLVMGSKIPWAGAHNEGDTVGKGAHLPPRTFLEWTPEDFDQFVAMATDRGLTAYGG